MNIDIPAILGQLGPAPSPHDKIIVAGCGNDMPASALLDWVQPVFNGLKWSEWRACEFTMNAEGAVSARILTPRLRVPRQVNAVLSEQEVATLRKALPETAGLAVITLGIYTNQAFNLLDTVAAWLAIYDIDDQSVQPLVSFINRESL